MSENVSIKGLDKAVVLAALYNAARPQGMGFMHYDPTPMTPERAAGILNDTPRMYFDYLRGRVMKVDLSGYEFSPLGYDRDNGDGIAGAVIQSLRETGDVNSAAIQFVHSGGVKCAADLAKHLMSVDSTIRNEPGMVVAELGLSDVKDQLGPRIAAAEAAAKPTI